MNYGVIRNDKGCYLECTQPDFVLSSESDAMELVSFCMNHNTNNLLIHEKSVSPDFFKLKTGLAGEVLRKFQIYNIRAALVLQDKALLEGRFGEMAVESNRGKDFHIYDNAASAAEWLTSSSATHPL